jgi:hypothetical protein
MHVVQYLPLEKKSFSRSNDPQCLVATPTNYNATCKLLYPLSISKCLASEGILLIILSLEPTFFFSFTNGRASHSWGPQGRVIEAPLDNFQEARLSMLLIFCYQTCDDFLLIIRQRWRGIKKVVTV